MGFNLGQVVMTPGAITTAGQHEIDVADLLRRHHSRDWGDVEAGDKRLNDRACKDGSRILSAYGTGDSKLWIITDAEWDDGVRRTTTILRPDEY